MNCSCRRALKKGLVNHGVYQQGFKDGRLSLYWDNGKTYDEYVQDCDQEQEQDLLNEVLSKLEELVIDKDEHWGMISDEERRYEEGYNDGIEDAIEEIKHVLKELEQ